MKDITRLLHNNKEWAERVRKETPDFFTKLKRQQKPKYLWIGCSDSRVPANQITGLLPGEVFVHRNISNQVINTDMNLMCVLQYAIDILKVKHIIVCGHYGCGGIEAVLHNKTFGLLEHWLDNVKAFPDRAAIPRLDIPRLPPGVESAYSRVARPRGRECAVPGGRVVQGSLRLLPEGAPLTADEMCELNVITQVENLSRNTTVQKAWQQKRKLYLHGWIYSISDGLIKDLGITKNGKTRKQKA